ncbi:MAG: recombinase family protein, partial [Chloroflexi bacterium]|nr:recombinase family protein [Chloroflexota bacterium]
MPKHPTALVYLRVSTGEQERTGVGLAFQRATCAQYAQAHGLTIGRHYLDVMPGDRDERPQYQALLREVRELRARDEQPVVIVAALDRLGRRLLEAVRCREELKQLGVGLHSVREGGELPDLVANFLSAVAQEEVRRRRERLSAGWRHVVQAGWYAPSATPWGYVRRPATQAERVQGAPSLVLDVCHQEARVVRELFQRAADGQSLRALEQWFGSLPPGITARRMSSLRVRHTLTNPAYVGRVRQDWPLGSDGPPGHWPALIDEATWAVVQAHVGSPHWASRASGSILLTNFLPCPRCGHKTSCAVAGNPSDHFYRCASGRGCPSFVAYRPIVDRMVLAHVLQLVVAFRTEQHANLRGLHQAWSRTCRAPAAGAKSTSGSRARSALARPHAHERLGRAAEL